MEESVQKKIIKLSTLKLKPYRKFIKRLLKIEEQGLVSEKDYRALCTLFKERIMLYLNNARTITKNLTAIGRCVGRGNENDRLRDELRPPVLAIINILMQDMGFGGKLNVSILNDFEKAENDFFPRLFRQAIKEALDNVLVNYSDYCLLNRGVYVREKDGEYIIFSFINDHPHGCKIMIGPFTNEAGAQIIFRLYIPRYLRTYAPQLPWDRMNNVSLVRLHIDGREFPLNISVPLHDSCLIELEQEDSYNDYIPSFSFNDRNSIAPYRKNYAEIAFALGQRAKYIFIHSFTSNLIPLYEYIETIEKKCPACLYPGVPWKLDENGDFVDRNNKPIPPPLFCPGDPPDLKKLTVPKLC